MKKLDQKGFGVVEYILAVLVIALLVGIGFYVVSADRNKKENAKTAETAKTIKTADQKAKAKPVEQPKVEYVELKDLGIKFKQSEKMSDWSYVVDPQVPMTRYVHSAAHVKKIDECNKGGQYPSLGTPSEKSFAAFSKINGTFNADNSPGDNLVKQFDTFYISAGYPNGAPCLNENGVGYPVESSPAGARDALLEALKTAEKL